MRLSYSNYALLRQVYDENNMESTKLEWTQNSSVFTEMDLITVNDSQRR
jgi:hypothetical protein